MKSLKYNLVVMTLILVSIPFAISNLLSNYFISKDYNKIIEEDSLFLADSIANNVKLFIEKAYSITEEISNNSEVISFQKERQKSVLVNCIKRNTYFDLLFIQGTDGMQTAKSSGELGDRSNRWWFTKIMSDNQPFVTKSYYSLTGNAAVTSIILPIYDAGSALIGVMGADLKLDNIQKMVEEFKRDDGSYAFIIDGDGVVIAHPDSKQVAEMYNYKSQSKTVLVKDSSGNILIDESGNQKTKIEEITVPKELKEIIEAALSGKRGIKKYIDNNGEQVISAYSAICLPGVSDNWAVITVQNHKDALQFVSNVQTRNIVIALIMIFVAMFFTYLVSNSIAKPITNLSQIISKFSNYDFTYDENSETFKYLERKDEIGSITRALMTMQKNIVGLTKEIAEGSQQVAASSEELSAITHESSISAEEVARVIEEIAKGANDQAMDTEKGALHANELGNLIVLNEKHLENMNVSTNSVIKLIDEGLEVVKDLVEKTKLNHDSSKEINEVIINTNNSVERIETASQMIKNIAAQTNLLALNAAIEAARAGDVGKGFAVVAEEIRKLAEQSNAFTGEITDIIHELTDKSGHAVDSMKEVGLVVKGQMECVDATSATFENIKFATEDVKNAIENISKCAQEMNAKREEVIRIFESLSAISEENAAGTQEASASMEEQTSSIEEIANASEALAKIAEEMQKSISKFKL